MLYKKIVNISEHRFICSHPLKTSGKINLNTIPLIVVQTTPGVTVAQQFSFLQQGLTQRLFSAFSLAEQKELSPQFFYTLLERIFADIFLFLPLKKKEIINRSPVCISNELTCHLPCFLHLLCMQWQSGKVLIVVVMLHL